MFTMDTKITNFLVNYLDDIIILGHLKCSIKNIQAKRSLAGVMVGSLNQHKLQATSYN